MHNIKPNFDKVLETAKHIMSDLITEEVNYKRTGPKPKFSDIEVISLNIVSECLFINNENLLFKKLAKEPKDNFPNVIERSQYNKRKRKLFAHIEEFKKRLAGHFSTNEDYFVIDSMPLEICKNSWINRLKYARKITKQRQQEDIVLHKTCMLSNITALTVVQFFNKFIIGRLLNNIKHAIS